MDRGAGRLQSMGLLRVRHDWGTSLSLFTFMHWRRKWQPTPVFLPGESHGRKAWWAAVHGVAQSRTRLKRLSSSSRRNRLGMPWMWVPSFLPSFQKDPVSAHYLPGESRQEDYRDKKLRVQEPEESTDPSVCSPGKNADHLLKSQWRSWKVATGFCEMEILKINKRLALGLPGSHQPWSSAGNNEEKQTSFAFFFIANMKHKQEQNLPQKHSKILPSKHNGSVLW